MSVVTQDMLELRVGEAELIRLTDDTADGTTDTEVMQQIIDDAESELLSRIGQRYTRPLALGDSDTARVVAGYCLDVVVYRLYLRRDRGATEDLAATYKAAIAWAQQIADGRLGLNGETKLGSPPTSGGQVAVISTDPVISRATMLGL